MHTLKPETTYKLVTIQVVVSSAKTRAQIYNEIEELLSAGMSEQGDDFIVHDWQLDALNIETRKTGKDPQEGELFDT